jgi:hypothetical protein
VAQEPALGAGQDGEPVPPGGTVTPDWVNDAEWERICGSRTVEDEPEGLGEDWDAWDPGPEDGPPPEWAEVDLAAFAAQAEAEGAEHDAVMRRLVAAGAGDGFAHAAGAAPVPGVATGPAAGFGQGRCLDSALPCTGLAWFADDASDQDRRFTGATDDELLGVLSARARLESREAWERLMAVAEFIRRRPEAGCALEGPGRMPQVWQESATAELRAQLHLSPGEASALLDLAHDLAAKLLRTSAALRDGIIDLERARWMSWRCKPLTAEEAARVEDLIFGDPEVAEWTLGMFRDRVSRAVIVVNPEAAIRRREESARERRVEVRREESGNAALAGRELPPAAVLAASQALTARAKELRRAGIKGGMDELRVQAYLEKLGVLDPFSSAQADAGPGGSPGGGSGGGDGGKGGRGPAGPGAGGPGGGASAVPGAPPGAVAARGNLTLPLATLLGLAERPGTMPRIGPVDPAQVRELAAAAARHPATNWCLTITDDQGRPVAHGCGRPSARRPRNPRNPRNPSSTHNPSDRRQHAPPDGAARDGPVRYIPADDQGAPGGDQGAPGGLGTVRLDPAVFTGGAGWVGGGGADLAFTLETLAGPCDHKQQARGHGPGKVLRHLTGILNAHCTFPPCRRPESNSDYEHSRPFERGGRTCLCEAGPVCRHDHRVKQGPGWHLEEAGARGWFRWNTPAGRSYLGGPTRYPD